MVLMVPPNPLYFGAASPVDLAWIYSLTVAVTRGMVRTSATQAAKEAQKKFFAKKRELDSPGLF